MIELKKVILSNGSYVSKEGDIIATSTMDILKESMKIINYKKNEKININELKVGPLFDFFINN